MSYVFPWQWAHGTLDRVVVDLDATVAEEQRQSIPVIERIVDRLGQLRLGEQLVDHLAQSRPERRHQRCASAATGRQPLLGTAAANLRFDPIDCLQPFDHLARERRLRRLEHLDKFAAGMGQTKSQLDRPAMTAGGSTRGALSGRRSATAWCI